MIDYLYSTKIWTWDGQLSSLAVKSWLLPLFAALLSRHGRRKEHRRVLAFVVYTFIMEQITASTETKNYFHPDTNYPWYHLLTPGLFFLMTRFYADYLRKIGSGWLVWALPLSFTILVAGIAFVGGGFYAFPTLAVAVYSFTGILLTIGYFVFLLNTLEVLYLERQPMFWIAAGLLIYYASNVLVWIGVTYLVDDAELFWNIFRINHAVTILLNVFFVIAVLLDPPDNVPTAEDANPGV